MTILRALRKRAWIVILLFLLPASQDAFGNRVSKTVSNTSGTTTTQYLVEDDVNPTGYPQVLDELVGPIGSAAVQRTYTYGLQRISQVQIAGNVLSYYQYDGGGSVRQLTNSVGQVTDSYEYDAFGNSFTKVGTTPNNYLYRGEQYDPDLGLYYLRARYYNPATGRFLSRDPEDGGARDPASLHKYLYANGDPVNGLDPSGRADATETGLTFALIGTAPVPELTALVAAAAEAAGDAAILASEVAQTLAEAEVAIARGAYAAAAALIQSAFARYMAVAMEETRWGAIVRFLTCETIALVLTEIIDKNYELPVKWQIRVDIYSGGTCLAVAFGK